MSFSLFKEQNNSPTTSFSNEAKNKEIKEKLCNKRMLLELEIENPSLENRPEKLSDLLHLKNAMKTFGISEIDYQIYLEAYRHKNA